MSVETDLAYVLRELRAMKSFARPMLDLLRQHTLTIPPSGNPGDKFVSLQFVDNTRHMAWMIPGGLEYAALTQASGAGLLTWRVRQRPNATGTIIFSSFDDYALTLMEA
ncbi:MAG: hypothetical protein [Bacteriophage sp.]|nr:MAG: hypothetical protein [Bacteriophage sp.]